MKAFLKFTHTFFFSAGAVILFTAGCTNFTTDTPDINGPVLASIEKNSDSLYIIHVMARNQEIGFTGYRLYTGVTEKAAREAAAGNGFDCGHPLTTLPNSAIVYKIEVTPDRVEPLPGTTDTLCTVPLRLTAGTWVALRSLFYKDFLSRDTSMSSNALLVP
jgi:hypothetical protein